MHLQKYLGISFIFLVFGLVMEWRIYETQVFNVPYDSGVWTGLVWMSGTFLALNPLIIGTFKQKFLQECLRWRVQRNFFRNTGSDCHVMGSCQSSKGNTLADVPSDLPQYIGCTTSNNWKLFGHDDKVDPPFGIFTMESGEEPVATRFSHFKNPSFKMSSVNAAGQPTNGELLPPVSLSETMSTSAAAVASNMGRLGLDQASFVLTISGMSTGRWQDTKPPMLFWQRVIPLAVHITYFSLLIWCSLNKLPSLAYLLFALMVLYAVLVGSLPQFDHKITRELMRFCQWLLPSIYDSFLEALIIVETNSKMPRRVYLTDGGHVENLGLYPLLVKRKRQIVVVDSYTDPDESSPCLKFVLMQAREHLGCSFYALREENGKPRHLGKRGSGFKAFGPASTWKKQYGEPRESDSLLDVRPIEIVGFVDEPNVDFPGQTEDVETALARVFEPQVDSYQWSQSEQEFKLPRAFHFYVRYPDGSTGKITYLKPRQRAQNLSLGEGPRNMETTVSSSVGTMSQEDVAQLHGCCCNCCQRSVCGISSVVCGKFPKHSTLNQFFSEGMFRAYHENGYAAMMEAMRSTRWRGPGLRGRSLSNVGAMSGVVESTEDRV